MVDSQMFVDRERTNTDYQRYKVYLN